MHLAGAGRSLLTASAAGRRGEQLPAVWDALELVFAAIGEGDPRARDEVPDRARDEHLPFAGVFADARGDVDCDAADVVAHDLTLAGVNPGANPNSVRR